MTVGAAGKYASPKTCDYHDADSQCLAAAMTLLRQKRIAVMYSSYRHLPKKEMECSPTTIMHQVLGYI